MATALLSANTIERKEMIIAQVAIKAKYVLANDRHGSGFKLSSANRPAEFYGYRHALSEEQMLLEMASEYCEKHAIKLKPIAVVYPCNDTVIVCEYQ